MRFDELTGPRRFVFSVEILNRCRTTRHLTGNMKGLDPFRELISSVTRNVLDKAISQWKTSADTRTST